MGRRRGSAGPDRLGGGRDHDPRVPPAGAGHAGVLRSIEVEGSGARVLVLGARTHLYEGAGVDPVVHGVRTAAAAGCGTMVLTNGCGGVDPARPPGTPVLISDQINH